MASDYHDVLKTTVESLESGILEKLIQTTPCRKTAPTEEWEQLRFVDDLISAVNTELNEREEMDQSIRELVESDPDMIFDDQ